MKLYWRVLRYIDKIKYKKGLKQRAIFEANWANLYHDSINDKPYLKELALAPHSYACNYSLLYILSRIIFIYKIDSILEFGLGESSKFISTITTNNDFVTKHDIVEHSEDWANIFKSNFELSKYSSIKLIPHQTSSLRGFSFMSYRDISKHIRTKYKLYVIDGPLGSRPFSRRDILELSELFTLHDDFIIIMDDGERLGEYNTVKDLLQILRSKNIQFHVERFDGLKSQYIIATDKFKYACTI